MKKEKEVKERKRKEEIKMEENKMKNKTFKEEEQKWKEELIEKTFLVEEKEVKKDWNQKIKEVTKKIKAEQPEKKLEERLKEAYFMLLKKCKNDEEKEKLTSEYENALQFIKEKRKEIKERKARQERQRSKKNIASIVNSFKEFIKEIEEKQKPAEEKQQASFINKEENQVEKPEISSNKEVKEVKEVKKQPVVQQVVSNKKEVVKMERYLEQKIYRHYYVDKSKLKGSNGLPFGDLFGTIWHPEIKIGEVVIHFVDEEKSNIFEEIKIKDVVVNKERNSSEIFEESKLIKEMKGELGGVDYIMVVTYRAMAIAGLNRHLLDLFKELNVPMAQDILNKKVRKEGQESLLMRIAKRYLNSSSDVRNELQEKSEEEGFNSVLGYIWYTECQNEESPIGEILLLLYGEEFKSLDFDDPKLWKIKLGRRVSEGEKPSVTYEEIQVFYSGNPEELFPLDKGNNEQNNDKVTTQIQLPVVIKYGDKYKVTKFIPNSVKINGKNVAFPFPLHRIVSGMQKQVVTTAFAEIQKRHLEGINGKGKNLIMVLYKLIDLDDLIKDYPIYKQVLIGWFNMSIKPSIWFKSYKKFTTDKSVFGYFSPDMSSKNNPLGLVAPACNMPGYEHLSWLGLAINPLEIYTGDHGKRMVGNAVIKAFPVNISKMPGNIYKTKILQEQLLTGSMMWELVVSDFEGNFTPIGEGALITKWGKEKIEGALEGKVEKGQPFKIHNDTSGEKSLTQGISKVAVIYYHGTKEEVFKGALSDENVAIIRAYNKRNNFVSVNYIGRERANKVLKSKASFEPIYVDAYNEKGELIYEKAELVLQKSFLDLTLDRRPMIVMQNNSSVQQEVLTFGMGKTKLPYQKYKKEVEERNKEAKDILFSAYYYLSKRRISINEHKVPELKRHPEKKLYVLDENNLKELRQDGIIFHGKRFFLPSYSTNIEGIGVVANDILTYVVNMSKRQVNDAEIAKKQIKILLSKIQATYERLSEVRIPMVRSRLAIMKNLGLKSMVVSPHILELLIEDSRDKRALEVLKAVGPKEFLKYYNIEVYGVRFPDFGYSGDYRIVAVDENLFETAAVSTLNAALIGGDVDDDTISLKIVSMTTIKGSKLPIVKDETSIQQEEEKKKDILENNQLEDEPLNKEVINMEKETKEPNVEFYVDGSYNSVTDKVGSAYIGLVDEKLTFKGTAQLSNRAGLRNVFGEITAALATVKLAKKKGYSKIKIYYDYSGIEKWVTGEWKAKNQITQKYSKLMQNSGVSIEFVKVKAHSGNKWNEVVDEMARKATLTPTTNSIQNNTSKLSYSKSSPIELLEKGVVIVNPVNTDGFMGKGLALEIAARFPQTNKNYVNKCKSGSFKPGDILFTKEGGVIIANLATKSNYKLPSKIEYIEKGLSNLKKFLDKPEYKDKKVILPKIGCGLGSLDWNVVRTLIEKELKSYNIIIALDEEIGPKESKAIERFMEENLISESITRFRDLYKIYGKEEYIRLINKYFSFPISK